MRTERKILNGWVIHAPLWHNLPSNVKWYGVYGSMFYINRTVDRVMFDYPETANHFYYLYAHTYQTEIIFASYSIAEVKCFIENMKWTQQNKEKDLYVYDAPTETTYKGKEFIKKFIE